MGIVGATVSAVIRFLAIIKRRVKPGMNMNKSRGWKRVKSVRAACGGFRPHSQWNPCTDARAGVWLRLDFERAIEKLNSFPHADEAEAQFARGA
jgi:hypothetical protein